MAGPARITAAFTLAVLVSGCTELEPPESALNCVECLPSCAPDVDIDDLEGTARRLGCDPALVLSVEPRPGWVVRQQPADVVVQLDKPLERGEGSGCDGPIRVQALGAVNAIPHAIAADIVTHASLHSLPLWPRGGRCVPGTWSAHDRELSFRPERPFEAFTWYEARVSQDLAIEGGSLCSELSWRFTVSACGDGVVDVAEAFIDWVCLGHVEADRAWFDPYTEECDDGNQVVQDGCSAQCLHETGWSCDEDGCRTRCGDGIRAGDEECDYGKYPPPGCNDRCEIEDIIEGLE